MLSLYYARFSNSLSSPRSRRNYKFAIEQFITWYCSEPRLSLNRAVVLRFRLYLESLGLAAATINQRLAAVRRLAYEAADSGLLSPELAAGIRRVKGVKQLGVRAGNWLTIEQARSLLEKSDGDSLRSSRDLAMISILLDCGLRRAELSSLRKEDIQDRHGHWVIVDLVGKGGHIRTVPMPIWVKNAVDRWMMAAKVTDGAFFGRSVGTGQHGAAGSPKTWFGTSFEIVPADFNSIISLRTICGELVPNYAMRTGGNLSRFSFS